MENCVNNAISKATVHSLLWSILKCVGFKTGSGRQDDPEVEINEPAIPGPGETTEFGSRRIQNGYKKSTNQAERSRKAAI